MPLIKSISGIRGTIGGRPKENLSPEDILCLTRAYAVFIKKNNPNIKVRVVIGRDGRVSGEMVKNLVVGALLSQGVSVIDLGLASTPTVELAVVKEKAQGGIIISASHNPAGWNALKLLNQAGEFLSQNDGVEILRISEINDFISSPEDQLGIYVFNPFLLNDHLFDILNLKLVDRDLIAQRKFKVVVDGINSVGGLVVVELLKKLGLSEIIELNCEPNGIFAHKPEPLAENLSDIREKVKQEKADLGIVVDPDVDRLALIMENGEVFGEEYTLVAVAEYVLANFELINHVNPGRYQKAVVSNLSSSRALKDVTEKHGGRYEAAAVGEVNVVNKMKEIKAVIGGEGNGGVIFPELHYGRDALVGVALFLSYLAKKKMKISELRAELPEYFMIKDRLELTPGIDIESIFNKIKTNYRTEKITAIDGVKIDWPDSWVHLRASNTEPIIRIYAEASSTKKVEKLLKEIRDIIFTYIK